MALKYLTNIDLNQNELQNSVIQNLAAAPSSPKKGQMYFNTATNKAMVYNGSAWVPWEANTTISPATANPVMDGTAAVGTSAKYAREDHVHPSDTTKADKSATVSTVAYDSTNKKITKTINGTTSDVVTVATLKTALNLAKGDVGLGNVDNTADANKSVASAAKLTTARNIDGISFDGSANIHHYGTCETAAGTAAKVATIEDSETFTLAAGAMVFIKMSYANGVANPTLNVNSTGAKSIKRYGTTAPSTSAKTSWQAGSVVGFVYDGSYWQMIGWLNDDTTTDTKNTAGSTNSSSKLFLIGATVQGASPQTYSHDTIYAGTDGHVYSNDRQVVNVSDIQALTNKTYNGYTLGAACAKGVWNDIEGDNPENLATGNAVIDYVDEAVADQLATLDAMRFKGTIGTGGDITALPTSGVKQGDTYRVITAGTYASQTCEVGDLIIATSTTPTWTVAQTNIDGAITGLTAGANISITGSGSSRTIAVTGIANGAEVNQNAFSNVKVGSTTVAADSKTDTLELVAGNNVTLTPDATNDKVTIAATDTTYESKTAASGGTDVSLVTTGEKYTWNQKTSNTGTVTSVGSGTGLTGGPITTSGSLSLATVHSTAPGAKGDTSNQTPGFGSTFKVTSETVDAYGRTTALAEHTVKIPNSVASTSAAGLMSAADKTKLDGIVSEASVRKYYEENTGLTPSGGVCTWTVNHNLGNTIVDVIITEVDSGARVMAEVIVSTVNSVIIKLISDSTIPPSTYEAIVFG